VVLGALTGAALGAVLCKKNKAACAGGGAAAGGLLGGGAGYLVAQKNTQAASREDAIRIRTQAAEEDIAHFDRVIAATNGVIAQHRHEVASLKAAYRKDAASLSGVRQERANITGDIQALKQAISANEERVSAITSDMQLYGSEGVGLAGDRQKMLRQQKDLQMQLKNLLGLEEGIPTV
jgi:chromosome segregation ATPase